MEQGKPSLEKVSWELEESIRRESQLEERVKGINERLDAVEKTLIKANIAGIVGLGMLSLMGAAMAWIVTHIEYLAKLLGVRQ